MRLVSWNVNGIRAVMKKDFLKSFHSMQTDILCLQETKAQDNQVSETLTDIKATISTAIQPKRKGIRNRHSYPAKPLSVHFDMALMYMIRKAESLQQNKTYFLVTVYTPNSGSELKRLGYRQNGTRPFSTTSKCSKSVNPSSCAVTLM